MKEEIGKMIYDADLYWLGSIVTVNLVSFATDLANLAVAGVSLLVMIYRLRRARRKDRELQKNQGDDTKSQR